MTVQAARHRSKGVRRSQAERSADTRRRILDATFAALDELGYAGATTSEVCRRAGVPRGTLLHHYPTTADLVTAAAEDIFARRLAEYREAFAALPSATPKTLDLAETRTPLPGGRRDSGRGRSGQAIELLWRILAGPTYYAWLEILVASRTDRQLRRKVRQVMENFGAAVNETFAAMFTPRPGAPIDARLVPGIVFPLLNGLAVDRIYADHVKIDATVALLRHLADQAHGWLFVHEVES